MKKILMFGPPILGIASYVESLAKENIKVINLNQTSDVQNPFQKEPFIIENPYKYNDDSVFENIEKYADEPTPEEKYFGKKTGTLPCNMSEQKRHKIRANRKRRKNGRRK